jgi:universal stress protein E
VDIFYGPLSRLPAQRRGTFLMEQFRNILVGIDLTQCEELSVEALPRITRDLFEQSLWLAQKTSARLTFLSALNLSAEALNLLVEGHRLALTSTIEQNAGIVLAELARQAKARGVAADTVFVRGKGWLEIIRHVLRGDTDLVLVGTRNLTGVRRRLLGNTALKLFRRCPCPVWVCRPEPLDRRVNILVASDLKPASDIALRLAISLAAVVDANVHVLYAVEHALLPLWVTALPDEVGPNYQRTAIAQAEQLLHEQVRTIAGDVLNPPAQIHYTDDFSRPDEAIFQFCQDHRIDLLVMGSIGRGGASGVMIGNTAERLLPVLSCSVLVVKPPDFVCPISPP